MKKIFAGVGIAALLACSLGAQNDVPDVSGHYNVEGTGSKGDYSGCAVIVQQEDRVFVRFFTSDNPDEPSAQGLGFIKDGMLVYGFAVADGVGNASLYKIEGDKLVGSYAEPGGVFTEVMTKGEHKDAPKGIRSIALLTNPR